MRYPLRRFAALLLFTLSFSACNRGLAPTSTTANALPSLAGTLSFRGNWPVKDSARLLAIVLVRNDSPFNVFPFKVLDLIKGVSDGRISFQQVNYHSSDTTFRFDVKPGLYSYLGVAEQYGPDLTADWRAIGYHHDSIGNPILFDLKPNEAISDVHLTVNFDSLPWQPFIK